MYLCETQEQPPNRKRTVMHPLIKKCLGCAAWNGNEKRASLLIALGLALLAFIQVIRFINLDADVVLNINRSGDVLTDEGWYANAAVRQIAFGAWYNPGDFNPAVNMPLGQMIHWVFFSFFDVSLHSARLSVALAFSAAVAFTAHAVGTRFGRTAGLSTALLLSSNYVGFAFSRMAIMEPFGMALASVAIWAAVLPTKRHPNALFAVASMCAVLAFLVKSSMVFAIAVVALAPIQLEGQWRARILRTAAHLGFSFVCIVSYQSYVRRYYTVDLDYFNWLNLSERVVKSFPQWLYAVNFQAHNLMALGKFFVIGNLGLAVVAFFLDANFRRNVCVKLFGAFFLIYFLSLTILVYGPPRYFVPLLIPISALGGMALVAMGRMVVTGKTQPWPRARLTALSLFGVIIFAQGFWVELKYSLAPHYTYISMLRSVREVISAAEGTAHNVSILGNVADTLSLETKSRSVNFSLGTDPVADRLSKNKPRYGLFVNDRDEPAKILAALNVVSKELGSWDVFSKNGDPRSVRRVSLFYLEWPSQ